MIHDLSVSIANYIGKELELRQNKIEVVSYGLEVSIGGLIKLTIFTIVPLLFGVFNQFAASYICSASLRIIAGGHHCTAYYKCLITTLITYMIISQTCVLLPLHFPQANLIFYLSILIAFAIFIKLAPVDVEEKPIRSGVRRKKLKIISCLLLVLYIPIFIYWNPTQDIYLACGLAILFQSFLLTSYGLCSLKWVDVLFNIE